MFSCSGKKMVEILGGIKSSFYSDAFIANNFKSANFDLPRTICKGNKELDVVQDHNKVAEELNLSFFKLLVVEDDLINQKIAEKMFQKMNVQFKIAKTGREALDRLRNEYFDLVLMDCYMAEMSGYEATMAIRTSRERFSNIPVIACSAGLSECDTEASKKAGMNDFILKPINYEKLLAKIMEWASRIYEGLPILDISALDKISAFDDVHQSLLRSLFQIYSENTQEELFKMRDLIQDGEIEKLRKKAHMLKSSAAQLGALRFEKFCILMEHDEALDIPRAKVLHLQMCKEYENSRTRFSEHCSRLGQHNTLQM